MPRILLLCALLLASPAALRAQAVTPHLPGDAVERLIRAATRDSAAWNRVAEISDRFGARLSGSESLERAIDWILAEMKADGLENVRGEPVMVPRWVRGEESAELVSPRETPLHMLGLGGSVATPRDGVTADVLIVGSFDELTRRAGEARGKIVLFDVPFTEYGETVRYRTQGASAAARAGAVASLVRSIAPFGMQTPHTGSVTYDSAAARIPAAAISMEDALMMRRMQARGDRVRVRLRMEARTMPDAPSRNVVAELRGRESPEEIVVLGGHIDSWDVGTGAMDDAGGSVAAWQAVRLMKELGLRPRRTVRVVLWTNEENGTAGAKAYRDQHRAEIPNHVLAMESDAGTFAPLGFAFTGTDSARATIEAIARLLQPVGATTITRGSGGVDIEPLEQLGVPGLGLQVDRSRYFWYHHTAADTPDKLDPAELARCVAAMAVMAYLVAEMPERLPAAGPIR